MSALDPTKFVDFKLKKIIPYNHNSSKFVFELPDNQASLLPVTSCVVVTSATLKDADGKPIIRPYTPVSASDALGELTFLIKTYEAGNLSKHIHSLKEGDVLSIKGPIPKFPYQTNQLEEVALLGGGTGIAPFYQLLLHALADKNNTTKFKLIYSNIAETDILLREELDAFKKQFPDTFDVVYLLEQTPAGWTGPVGYITADHVKKHIGPASLGEKIKVFVCGPPPQVASLAGAKDGFQQGELAGILKDLGFTSDQVFKF